MARKAYKVIEVNEDNGDWRWRIVWRDADRDETLADGFSDTADGAWRAARKDWDNT